MSDERDRLGDKLHDVEKAREDQWARQQDQQLLEKLRQRQAAEVLCPQCNSKLVPRVVGGIAILACPSDHGAWLDAESLRHLPKG
jgi:Transcription factor zinc-finger